MSEKHWFDPSLLEKMDDEASREVRLSGDFSLYNKINKSNKISGSGIESHNLVHAYYRCVLYYKILKTKSFGQIADMGCGIGLTTQELKNVFSDSNVIGYDVSSDAIDYAKRTFNNVEFARCPIGADTVFDRHFDLIIAQEFYPFTRTSDWQFQKPIINMMMNHLNPGGVFLIELSERHKDNTILANLNLLSDMGARIYKMPFDRVFRSIPILGVANLVSDFIGLFIKRDRNHSIIFQRR